MFKKIKMFNKLCKIIDAVEEFYKGNEEKIKKIKELIPEIKEYISKAEKIIKAIKDKVQK